MADGDQRVEQDSWIVELIAEALHAEPHALLQDRHVMVVGKDDDAGVKALALHLGKHLAAVHVGKLPA